MLQSAKTNLNVEEVFFSIGRDIKQRLSDTDSKAEVLFTSLSALPCVKRTSEYAYCFMFLSCSIAACDDQDKPNRPGRWSRPGHTEVCMLWKLKKVVKLKF